MQRQMRSATDVRAMRERVRKAWGLAVAPEDGPRQDEMKLELQLHAAEIAIDFALGNKEAGRILLGWVREAEGPRPAR